MRGLKKQESKKFNTFFSLIQTEAEKQSMVFFADAGDGNEFETPEMEGEDMMGWLIPKEKAEEFEKIWQNSKVDDTWSDFFKWATWKEDKGNIVIAFE